jgi:hypothetical protein
MKEGYKTLKINILAVQCQRGRRLFAATGLPVSGMPSVLFLKDFG